MRISNKQDLLEEIKVLYEEIASLERQRDIIHNEIKDQREWKSIVSREKENIEDIIYTKEKQLKIVDEYMNQSIQNFHKLNEKQQWQLILMAQEITRKQEELNKSNKIKIIDKESINNKIKSEIDEKIQEISKLNDTILELKSKSDEINNDKRIKDILDRETKVKEREDQLTSRESEIDQKTKRMQEMRKYFNQLPKEDG